MDDKLSIGAVSQLTGVSQHTLRKWESRHGIGIPERSETGRRVYSRETVGQLRAIKGLLDQDKLEQSINKIYSERKKIYNESNFRIKCNSMDKDEIVFKIIELYESSRNKI